MPRSTCAVSVSAGSRRASIASRGQVEACTVIPMAARIAPRRSFSAIAQIVGTPLVAEMNAEVAKVRGAK